MNQPASPIHTSDVIDPSVSASVPSGGRREVAIIDAGVAGWEALAAQVPQGVELVVLAAGEDGLAQLSQWAAGRSNYDAIHILSHGAEGALYLGTDILAAASLADTRVQAVLAELGKALASDGDILLYGCDVASGEAGRAFIAGLAELTGADVAASTNLTGTAQLGGDWSLEYRAGDISTDSVKLSESLLQGNAFSGTLASGTLDFSAIGDQNAGLIVTDGNLNSQNVADIVVEIFGSNTSSAPAQTGSMSYHRDITGDGQNKDYLIAIDQTSGIINATDSPKYLVIRADKAFSLKGFELFDFSVGSVRVEGFLNGVSQGSVDIPTMPSYLPVVTEAQLPANKFGNITHFALYYDVAYGFSGGINAINFGDPVVPVAAPTLSATAMSRVFTEDGGATLALFSGVNAAVNDSGQTFTGLTLTVTNVGTGDMLGIGGTSVSLTNTAATSLNGSGNYAVAVAGGTATVTLTGLARNDAAMKSLVESITYNNSSQAPSNANRVVTITGISDSGASNNTAAPNIAATVTVAPVNDAPVLDAAPVLALAAVAEDAGAPVNGVASGTLVSSLVGGVSDPDQTANKGIAITAADAANGSWWFTTDGGASWTALGTPGEAAARLLAADSNTRVHFSPNANWNGSVEAALTFRAWDRSAESNGGMANITAVGTGGTSPFSTGTDSVSLAVNAVNDVPTASNLTHSKSFTEDGAPVQLDAIVVTDVDAGDTVTATLTLSHAAAGGLSTGTFGSATSTYNAGTGTWTVSGSVADVNAALAAVSFTPAANWDQSLTITTRIRDAANTGPANGTITLTATGVPDAPTATNLDQNKAFTEDAGVPVALDSIVVADADLGETITATLTVGSPAAGNLTTGTFGSATSTYHAGTGVWTVMGSVADVNAALASVAFIPAANWDQNVTISTRIRDAAGTGPADGTITLSATPVNDTPVIVTSNGSAGYTEGASNFFVDNGLTLSDADHATLASASVSIGGFVAGQDVLGFTNDGATMGNIVASFDAASGVLSLSSAGAAATVAQWQNALRAVTYGNASDNPFGNRTIGFAANDGSAAGATVFKTVAITSVNDAPTTNPAHGYVNTGAAVETGGLVTISAAMLHEGDLDDQGSGVNYTVTSGATQGTLFLDANGNGVIDGGEALDMNATFVQDDIDQGRIKYLHGGGADAADAVTLTIADGGEDGAMPLTGVQFNITVSVRPVLNAGGASPAYTEDGPAAPLAPNLTIADGDSATMASATVTITDYVNGDVLGFVNQNGITGSYDSASGVLALSGVATIAQYQAALRTVTYSTGNHNPAAGAGNTDRVIRVVVNDGGLASGNVDIGVSVANANDAPVLDAAHAPVLTGIAEDLAMPVNGSTAHSTLVSALLGGASDVDTGALQGIAITDVSAQGSLWYSTDGGMSWSKANALEPSQALLLHSDARVYFQPNSNVAGAIDDALTFRAWDRSSGGNGGTADATINGGGTAFSAASDTAAILVTGTNDAPVLSGGATMTLPSMTEDAASAGVTVAAILAGVNASDADAGALSGLAVVGENPSQGQWQYSTDNGSTWHHFGSTSATSALLLGSTALVRYHPDLANGETGVNAPTFTFHAWDQSGGTPSSGAVRSTASLASTGGGTPFSAASASATIEVADVNDAPVLMTGVHPLANTDEETTSAVASVAALLTAAGASDQDSGASTGAVIIGASGNGAWQFSLDGSSWQDVGAPGDASALALASTAQLRFKPDGKQGGAATLTYRAWDRTDGAASGTKVNASTSGGSSAYSAATATASVAVSDVNDAPLNSVPAAQNKLSGEKLVFSTANGNALAIADIDAGTAPLQVALTASHGTISLAGTTGLTFTTGDGTADGAITVTGTLANINAALNGLEFTPEAGYQGAASVQIVSSDNGNTGSGGALSDTDTVLINYTARASGGGATPPVTSTIDGVIVQKNTVSNADGSSGQAVTIPLVQSTREEQIGNNTVADIPLVTEAGGRSLLAVQVPTGLGLRAAGFAAPKTAGTSLLDLIREIEAHTDAGSQDRNALAGGGSGFLQELPTDTPLLVQTIVPTAASDSAAPAEPLVITGTPQKAGDPLTALVINTRSLPAGSEIQLHHVEFAAVIGEVRVTGGAGAQNVWGDSHSQYIMLGEGDDVLHGGAGDDTVGSAGGNDRIFGDEGNDLVFGGEGNDAIDGGAGIDTARLLGTGRADYTMRVENGKLTVTHRHAGIDGTDTLAHVEKLNFAGAEPDMSTRGIITRMYDAMFDRAPDEGGLAYWVGMSASGMALADIARQFVLSAESQALPGSASNAQFVDGLYRHSLGRTADEAGRAYWIDMLEQGKTERATMMYAFANSAEKLAQEKADGYTLDFNRTDVATLVRMYDTLFDRKADAAGLNYWIATSESGMTIRDLAWNFIRSDEALATVGGMSNRQFVEHLYQAGLERQGGSGEVSGWVRLLDDNAISRADVLLGFADSAEMIALVGVMSTSIETV